MAAQVEIEDEASVTQLDNGEILDPLSDDADSSTDSMNVLGEGHPERDVISTCFLSGMGALASDTTIVTLRKNFPQGITTRAKFVAFKVFTDANVKYAWYAGSKEEVQGIMTHGFSTLHVANDPTSHGIGIHLVPSNSSLFAALATQPEQDHLRHLLLCRLLLGKPEPLLSASKQSYPSSSLFDSAVDNRKYLIWSSTMNSYILPTFRSPSLTVEVLSLQDQARPGFLSQMDSSRMSFIMQTYSDYRNGKIRRHQLVQKMRQVAGDNLLAEIIKNHTETSSRSKTKRGLPYVY